MLLTHSSGKKAHARANAEAWAISSELIHKRPAEAADSKQARKRRRQEASKAAAQPSADSAPAAAQAVSAAEPAEVEVHGQQQHMSQQHAAAAQPAASKASLPHTALTRQQPPLQAASAADSNASEATTAHTKQAAAGSRPGLQQQEQPGTLPQQAKSKAAARASKVQNKLLCKQLRELAAANAMQQPLEAPAQQQAFRKPALQSLVPVIPSSAAAATPPVSSAGQQPASPQLKSALKRPGPRRVTAPGLQTRSLKRVRFSMKRNQSFGGPSIGIQQPAGIQLQAPARVRCCLSVNRCQT